MPAVRSDRVIYLRVLGPLLLATIILVAVSVGGFSVLSATRAYVGGESLWSKGRSQAVAALRGQDSLGRGADCDRVDAALQVALGDRQARLEMDQPQPDLRRVRAGFLQGGNHPDDIDGLIRLYRHFRHFPFMQDAVQAWAEGDQLIAQLRRLAHTFCREAEAGAGAARMAQLLAELDSMDRQLAALETRFSRALGQASRSAALLLTSSSLSLALLLVVGSVWYVRRTLHGRLTQHDRLAEATTRWRLAAESAGLGLFAWYPDIRQAELDPRAQQLFGLPVDTTTRSSWLDMAPLRARIHPEDLAGLDQATSAAVGQRDSSLPADAQHATERLHHRHRVIWPDGSLHHLEVIGRAQRLQQPGRGSLHLVGVVREVSDEVAAEQLLIEKETAERAARLRSEFLSRLSHELRTPLNAILGLAQLLRLDRAEPLSPAQDARLQVLLQSGWHLLRLVDDVLDITRIDAGVLSVELAPTDLQAVLGLSLQLVEPERSAYQTRIVNEWPARTAPVMADGQRLQQVLVNLLSNGCKYNRRGGCLRLRYRETADQVLIEVEDQGKGMRADEVAQLFQPFKRMSPQPEVAGIGLGLVVVKLLVEQMGGQITVDSQPDRGSCFVLQLWRSRSPAGAEDAAPTKD